MQINEKRKCLNTYFFSNQKIYREIAKEAYKSMTQSMVTARRPNINGVGETVTFDPNRTSFKNAFICIVFTSLWLEALLYTQMVKKFGILKCEKLDKKNYEAKLALLGISDSSLLKQVGEFRALRKAIVHEKASLDIENYVAAQDEALKAYQLMEIISKLFQ